MAGTGWHSHKNLRPSFPSLPPRPGEVGTRFHDLLVGLLKNESRVFWGWRRRVRSRGGPIPPRTLPSARPQPRTTSRRTLDGAANPPAPTNPGAETPDPRRTLFFCRSLLSGSRAGGRTRPPDACSHPGGQRILLALEGGPFSGGRVNGVPRPADAAELGRGCRVRRSSTWLEFGAAAQHRRRGGGGRGHRRGLERLSALPPEDAAPLPRPRRTPPQGPAPGGLRPRAEPSPLPTPPQGEPGPVRTSPLPHLPKLLSSASLRGWWVTRAGRGFSPRVGTEGGCR